MGAEVGSRIEAIAHRIERVAVFDVAPRTDNCSVGRAPKVGMPKTVVMAQFMGRHLETERTVRCRAARAHISDSSIRKTLVVAHCKQIQVVIIRVESRGL